MVKKNVLETIGNTPIVELGNLVRKHGIHGKLYAKIEFYSPGLSKKDRIAKYIIEKAVELGELKKGQTVIEQTSGNTGIGVAVVCAVLGHPFVAVMSDGNSIERIAMIRDFGARVELVPQAPNSKKGSVNAEDMKLVEARFNELADELGAFKVGQFYNIDNANAHYYTTAREIIADVSTVDAFCDFIGTGGSFEGIARALKEDNGAVECFIVVPADAPHIIQGGGYGTVVPFADAGNCDGRIAVTNEETVFWMRELARTEAIAGGLSTGANLAGAIKYLKDNPGKSVVFLVNDPAIKYMSAPCLKE
jgi:cysteine synthase A